ncbi:hypothetical protein HX109_07305 [Galbibacter sp. BG1]|uniref:hypothetical protein n=1 Tax=Galbibacter sp. BG1 TaxID=1170699 RepID=UPI0015C07134|nr:hypothetical protein [Galbibacter sp. BG1]QLE01379.1 hypothetical protein HX109_07305 [Galbibacter sp. BG1]
MKTIDIRKKLIQEVNLSKNSNLLEELYYFLNKENELEEVFQLNEAQKTEIEAARLQIKEGHYLSNKKANKDIEKWLNE